MKLFFIWFMLVVNENVDTWGADAGRFMKSQVTLNGNRARLKMFDDSKSYKCTIPNQKTRKLLRG